MNVVLIGYRGSGKSAVGRALAARLGWPLFDTDTLIESATHRTIRDIFATDGEPAFRDLEAQAVSEATHGDQRIISTGGGAILRPENVERLKAGGKLVWLTAPVEVLWERIQADARSAGLRPNLTAQGGIDEVREILARRSPLYEAAADLTLDTANRSPESLADAIMANFDLR